MSGAGQIRVTLVAPSLRGIGGQSVQADILLRQFAADDCVKVRFVPTDPEFPRALRWIEKVPYLRTIVRPLFYSLALWRGTRDADVVHIFSASYWSFVLAPLPAWLIARVLRTKTIIHYHSGEAQDHLSRSAIARRVLAKADEIAVPSTYLVSVFSAFGLNAIVVPNAIETERFRYRMRRPLRPRLICTRSFEPYYRVDWVIRAFCEVRATYPDAELYLVGSGSLESNLRGLAAELGMSGIHFVGAVHPGEIHKWYAEADIFINASYVDNMPVSMLEAFAAGTPIVSTTTGGIKRLVEHGRTGLLCESGDWKDLASAVMLLLNDQDLAARLAANGFEESTRYSAATVREQWVKLYRELLDDTKVVQAARGADASHAISGTTQPHSNGGSRS